MYRGVTCVLLLLLAASASAQIDSWNNSFGIYFDESASCNCIDYVIYPVGIYLIVTNPTVTEVHGFALDLHVDVTDGLPGYWVPFTTDSLPIGVSGNFIAEGEFLSCTYGEPLIVTGPVVILLQTTGAYFAPMGHLWWTILPASSGDAPGIISLLDENDTYVSGVDAANGNVCAAFNEFCWVGNESVSFDRLKAMYR